MELIFNKFAILSSIDKKAFEIEYDIKTNLIVGCKDSGKSTVARAMMYTLGCDVKDFELKETMPNNIYILSFKIGNDEYILIRKSLKKGKGSNYFKLYKNTEYVNTFFNTKDYSRYLNKILNISMKTIDKKQNETQLYPNHIFLPFYTDQDNSWQNYLKSTFSNLEFIKDYKKIIIEYFVGARKNEYYDLKLEQSKLNNELQKQKALKVSKELIYQENLKNIKIIENIDVNEFKSQYKSMLEIYQNIISSEHELKNNINQKIYRKNSYEEAKKNLDSNINSIIEEELIDECANCHQKIEKDFSENYMLYAAKENLLNEREKITMYLNECTDDLKEEMNKLSEFKDKGQKIQKILDSNSKMVELAERADSYALNRINSRLLTEIDILKESFEELTQQKKSVDSAIRKLKEPDLTKKYKEMMKESFDELKIPFKYKTYYDSNFESVDIALSGTTKVQAFIVQYLTIFKMAQKNKSAIKIPMVIDSYIKDHFNEQDEEITTKFIFKVLTSYAHQAFVFITDNKSTISNIDVDKVNIIELNEVSNLFKQDYKEIYTKYEEVLIGD